MRTEEGKSHKRRLLESRSEMTDIQTMMEAMLTEGNCQMEDTLGNSIPGIYQLIRHRWQGKGKNWGQTLNSGLVKRGILVAFIEMVKTGSRVRENNEISGVMRLLVAISGGQINTASDTQRILGDPNIEMRVRRHLSQVTAGQALHLSIYPAWTSIWLETSSETFFFTTQRG